MVSFASVKGMKNFFFFEVHPMDFIDAVGSAYRMDNDKYMEYANRAREVFEKEYKMESRIREFRELVGL
jgi:hypothetical protein